MTINTNLKIGNLLLLPLNTLLGMILGLEPSETNQKMLLATHTKMINHQRASGLLQ